MAVAQRPGVVRSLLLSFLAPALLLRLAILRKLRSHRPKIRGLPMPDYLQRSADYHDPAVASALDELSFWSSRFGALLIDNLPIQGNISILDVGCGAGFPLFELAHIVGGSCRLVGIDIWREALQRARSKLDVHVLPNVSLVEADAARMPFAAAAFDVIVSNLGINNWEDPQAVAAECFRVSKPGARIALTTNFKGHMREFYQV